MTAKELWHILNKGGTITNGVAKVWYTDGNLHSDPTLLNPLVFQDDEDNEWEELVEEVVIKPRKLYRRWYTMTPNSAIKVDNDTFHPIEVVPDPPQYVVNEELTRDEIVGLTD